MLIWTMKFDRKKAAFWVIMAALVIVGNRRARRR